MTDMPAATEQVPPSAAPDDTAAPEPTPEATSAPKPTPAGEDKVRIAITLELPSLFDMGFKRSSESPEAAAHAEKILQEQQRIIDEAEELIGEPLDVVRRFFRSVNVISANVRESDIPAISAIRGVAKAERETLNELTPSKGAEK